MPITDTTRLTGSITDWSAFWLFTDRNEHIRRFLSYLYDETPHDTILFFYGEGGNGKSWLMRFLSEYCCKQLAESVRSHLSTISYNELIGFFTEDESSPIFPHAHLDFGMPPYGDARPKEPASALLMLRRSLARYGLRFPLYDYATLLYLHKTVGLTKDRINYLFPPKEASALGAILDILRDATAGKFRKAGLDLIKKYLFRGGQKQFTLWRQKRGLSQSDVETIERMDPYLELVDKLPILFAQDLNAAMQLEHAPSRVVLFFDTYDAFRGTERALPSDAYFAREEWFRALLVNLDLSLGIVTVVLSRDKPQWQNAAIFRIPQEYLDVHNIGYFSNSDAHVLLERAGVTDPDLRQALVTYASISPNEVHPYYLGLCLDVALAAKHQGTLFPQDLTSIQSEELARKGNEAIGRLLRYAGTHIEYAVRALSACRAFNFEIYQMLGEALAFQATPMDFDILISYSFVRRTHQHGDGWFCIDDLLRKLYRESHDEITLQAQAILGQYFLEGDHKGEPMAVTEALYHIKRLRLEIAN
ncbi:MAG: hypothetical protein WCD37_02660 [Chloroflexia bacterium]